MKILYALILIGLLKSGYCAEKSCAEIEAVPDVDLNKFLGVWYGVEYYPPKTLPPVCLVHNYTLLQTKFYRLRALCIPVFDRDTQQFTSPCYNLNTFFNSVDAYDKTTPGNHMLRNPTVLGPTPGGVKIVGTDQESYYVEYTCSGSSARGINAEIYTRDANPSSSVLEKAYQVLETNGLSRDAMFKYDHSDCERYELYRQLHSH